MTDVSGDRLQVDVLGPLRARDPHGRDVTPDGALQRRLLALLVLRRGQVVSPDAAIEVLWPVRRPRDPLAALHNHLFRLRRGLPLDVIESVGDGYRLRSVADRSRRRPAGRRGERRPARRSAPSSRRSTTSSPAGTARRTRSSTTSTADGSRRSAWTSCGSAPWRCAPSGGWRPATSTAPSSSSPRWRTEEPLRERPRALLMTALTRAGRTVEALRVYDDFRRLLGDELGIDPSPALAAQHAGLLGGVGEAGWAPASRLPVPVTSLVGREALLDEVLAMVDANRLVTLIGPGGVGKTRMLVEVGARLRAASPDRAVVMCELAAATEDSAVDAVAAALAIDGRPGVGLADRVAAVLADTDAVLLLDNCEHVLEPIAGLVEALLARCPNVAVLATSRERLRVGGERLCTVPTLAVTADDAPAVELFVERARAVAPGFDPGPGELAIVTEIVRRLDGLPLAIELAAARLHTLDVGEVAAGLDRRFELLSAGSRTSSRHGSLHAAVSWSYGLLDERAATDVRRPVGVRRLVHGCRRGGDLRRRHGPSSRLPSTSSSSARSSCAHPSGATCCSRRCAPSPPSSARRRRRADVASERHARHYVEWVEAAGRRRLDSGPPGTIAEIDARAPRAAHGAGLAARPRARRPRRPPRHLAVRLRHPAVAARRLRLVAARASTPTPTTATRSPRCCGRSAGTSRGWPATSPSAACGPLGRCASAELAGGDVPPVVAHDQRQRRPVRGPPRRCGQLVPAGRRRRRRGDPQRRLFAESTELLALAYGGDPTAAEQAATLLAELGARGHTARRLRVVLRRGGGPHRRRRAGPSTPRPRRRAGRADRRVVRRRRRRRVEGVDRRPPG